MMLPLLSDGFQLLSDLHAHTVHVSNIQLILKIGKVELSAWIFSQMEGTYEEIN